MNYHLLRCTLLGIAGSACASAFAQDIPFILTTRPDYTISAAIRFRSGGANVKFGSLGTTGRYFSNGAGSWQFDDGYVTKDSPRSQDTFEGYTSGNAQFVEKVGNRVRVYAVTKDANGNEVKTLTNDYLGYQDGVTRSWGYNSASQVQDGYVAMHYTYTTSRDQTLDADSGSSAGVDLTINRDLGSIGKRFQWGIAASVGVNDINAKTTQTITSDLHVMTYRFSLNGQPAPTMPDNPTTSEVDPQYPYSAPVMGPLRDAQGNVIMNPATNPPSPLYPLGEEYTTPLASTPTGDPTDVATPGGATVKGTWQVKGAYYLIRLGPSFRWQIHRRFSLSGSAGFAGGYLGSIYHAREEMIDPVVPNTPGFESELRMRKFLPGGFVELNAEFWMTYRTGFFVGGVYEKVGRYEQELLNRTAKVDIGSGLAFRVGVVHRF